MRHVPPCPRRHAPPVHAPRRLPLHVARAAGDPPPSGGDLDVGLLWKAGGGADAVLDGLGLPEQAVVPAMAAPKLPLGVVVPGAAVNGGAPTHSALRDRATFDRLHASSVAVSASFFAKLGAGMVWRNAPASGRARPVATRGGFVPPGAFFEGGRLNVAVNCVTRHVEAGQEGATAIAWPGGGLSFGEVDESVWRLAAWLSRAGVKRGDAVALLLPHDAPDGVVALLGVVAVGGVALVLDAGAPAADTAAAVAAAGARVALTASPLKPGLDEALALITDHAVDSVLVWETGGATVADTPWTCSRDVWAAAALPAAAPAPASTRTAVDADAPLLLVPVPGEAGVLVRYATGALVAAAATARFALDAASDAVVAHAGAPSAVATLVCQLGALANGSAVASLPRPTGDGAAFWQAAAAARATHVVAGASAAVTLASGAPPPATLRAVAVVDAGATADAARALAAALGDATPLVTGWAPIGAGTPVLAGAPYAVGLPPGGMVPWLGCDDGGGGADGAREWGTAWPALASGVAGGAAADAWWAANCVGRGGDGYRPAGGDGLRVDGAGVWSF